MPTTTSNYAAERLLHLIDRWSSPATARSLKAQVDEVLATECRATVQRIRERVDALGSTEDRSTEYLWAVWDITAILDEEAGCGEGNR